MIVTLKCSTVVAEFSRKGIAIRPARRLTAGDLIGILDQLFQQHGRPACLGSDNGSDIVCAKGQAWSKARYVDTHYIDPGSPWQNAYNESLNAIYRTT